MSLYNKSLSLDSTIDRLSQVEGLIDELYEGGQLTESVYGNVLVAVTEAFLNAHNHGNAEDPSKQIDLEFDIDDSQVVIKVSDKGLGFDFEQLPDPTSVENIEKVSGRGLFIIKNLSDELEFERDGATLVMTFQKAPKDVVVA